MKSNIKIFIPFVIAILLGSLVFIFAQSRIDNPKSFQKKDKGDFNAARGFRPLGFPPGMYNQLNLNDQQKEQIRSLQENARTALQTNFDQLKTIDNQLSKAAKDETFDENQVRTILNNKAQVMTEIEIIRLRNEAAIKGLLTTEQQAQLEKLKQQFPEPLRGRQGRNMPPPPPYDGEPNVPPPSPQN